MATSFPGSLDSFVNPSGSDALDSVSVPHATQHADLNDAVEALEAKVGVDGSAVTTSLDYKVAQQGLVLVKTQTVGTAVSSVTVTGAFSSTFDNYLVAVDGVTSSINTGATKSLSGATSGYSYTLIYTNWAGTVNGLGGSGSSAWQFCGVFLTAGSAYAVPIFEPNRAGPTRVGTVAYVDSGAGGTMVGYHSTATSYTGFVIAPGSGTMTGGTIRVYGYNNG